MACAGAAKEVGKKAGEKLRGWDWFHSIGSPKYVVAPMVMQSELAFRMMCRRLGAQLCFTPMIHSKVWLRDVPMRPRYFEHHHLDRPLVAQVCGHDPATLRDCALMLQDHCDAIDLNLGCPQGIARRGRYGAFLLTETDLLVEIVQTLDKALSVPVTCKIRMLDTPEATIALCKALEGAGCSMLTVHGRTKESKGHRIGACDWDIIRAVREAVNIPVLANGGIGCYDDVQRCLKHTGAAGVMSSEGVLENPALFSQGNVDPTTGEVVTNWDITRMYFEYAERYRPPFMKCVVSHTFKFLCNEWADHPHLRLELNKALQSMDRMKELCEQLIVAGQADQTRLKALADNSKSSDSSKAVDNDTPVTGAGAGAGAGSDAGAGAGAGSDAGAGAGAGSDAGAGAGAGAGAEATSSANDEKTEAGTALQYSSKEAAVLNAWRLGFDAAVAEKKGAGEATGGPWYMRHRIPRPKILNRIAAQQRKERKRQRNEKHAERAAHAKVKQQERQRKQARVE